MAASKVQTYGVRLVLGNTYMFKGVRFRKGRPAEVDLATRNHLVSTGHFRDADYEEPVAAPIPVARKSGLAVRRRPKAEAGIVSAEGGATATGDEGDDLDEVEDEAEAEEPSVEV